MKYPEDSEFIMVVDSEGKKWYKVRDVPGWHKSKKDLVLHMKYLDEEGGKKKHWGGRSRAVYQFNLKGVLVRQYESMSQAYRYTGIHIASINRCCKFLQDTAGGFKWSYEEETA